MSKSISESNNIHKSYLKGLFSYVSPKIGSPKLRIMYMVWTEIMKNIMI